MVGLEESTVVAFNLSWSLLLFETLYVKGTHHHQQTGCPFGPIEYRKRQMASLIDECYL